MNGFLSGFFVGIGLLLLISHYDIVDWGRTTFWVVTIICGVVGFFVEPVVKRVLEDSNDDGR